MVAGLLLYRELLLLVVGADCILEGEDERVVGLVLIPELLRVEVEGRVRTVPSDCIRLEVVPLLERILLAAPLVEEDVEEFE